MSGKSDPVNS